MKIRWHLSSLRLPEDNQEILFISADGTEVVGKFCKGRFCSGDMYYYYYIPKYWIALETAILSGRI